ncbi:hypothetical protein PINS_up007032 [Pythium insidiosum]|nr:hypothetical protein PINS_up007032 [Pythium insidiosum]
MSAGSRIDLHQVSASQVPKTAKQLLVEKQLKKPIEKYSTMRVHMQLCLEQEKRIELRVNMVFLVLILVLSSLLQLSIHFPYEQNATLDDLFFDKAFCKIFDSHSVDIRNFALWG